MKKALVLLLVICLLLPCFASCKNTDLPEGYTGGFTAQSDPREQYEYYWVETYAECIAAIDKLKSHGSTFDTGVLFSYEGDLFDTKYCFIFNRSKTEKIVFGVDDPFDRRAEGVEVYAYAFYDDVTIDQLIYSYLSDYTVYGVGSNLDLNVLVEKYPNLLSKELVAEYSENKCSVYFNDGSQNIEVFEIVHYANLDGAYIPEQAGNEIINSIEIFGDNYHIKK